MCVRVMYLIGCKPYQKQIWIDWLIIVYNYYRYRIVMRPAILLLVIIFYSWNSYGDTVTQTRDLNMEKVWRDKNLKDVNCMNCSCMGKTLDQKNWEAVIRIFSTTHYTVMGSRSYYVRSYFVNQGIRVSSDLGIDRACLTGQLNLGSGIFTRQANGVNSTSVLNTKQLDRMSVYNIEQKYDPFGMSSKDTDLYLKITIPWKLSVVWVQKSLLLATTCGFDGQSLWVVYSTEKSLSLKLMGKVMKKVKNLGFNLSKAYTPDFTKCPWGIVE